MELPLSHHTSFRSNQYRPADRELASRGSRSDFRCVPARRVRLGFRTGVYRPRSYLLVMLDFRILFLDLRLLCSSLMLDIDFSRRPFRFPSSIF